MERPFVKGTTPVRGLTITMVINHLLNGMILKVIRPYFKGGSLTLGGGFVGTTFGDLFSMVVSRKS